MSTRSACWASLSRVAESEMKASPVVRVGPLPPNSIGAPKCNPVSANSAESSRSCCVTREITWVPQRPSRKLPAVPRFMTRAGENSPRMVATATAAFTLPAPVTNTGNSLPCRCVASSSRATTNRGKSEEMDRYKRMVAFRLRKLGHR